MNNPRLTNKDKALLKGAIRRVFSRSELHHRIINSAIISHSDPKRPRVKTWCLCPTCKKPDAKSYFVVDHINPVIKINETIYDLEPDLVIDRVWCEENNLQPICKICHLLKSRGENKLRRAYKKERNKDVKRKAA